eukprot:3955918-Prymnesium_polylepis.1
MFYALDGIHGHTSQDHRFPSEQRSVKLALAGVVLQYGGGPHGKGRLPGYQQGLPEGDGEHAVLRHAA